MSDWVPLLPTDYEEAGATILMPLVNINHWKSICIVCGNRCYDLDPEFECPHTKKPEFAHQKLIAYVLNRLPILHGMHIRELM